MQKNILKGLLILLLVSVGIPAHSMQYSKTVGKVTGFVALVGAIGYLFNAYNNYYETLNLELLEACNNNQVTAAQDLLDRGADFNYRLVKPHAILPFKSTPLIAAAITGNITIVRLLLGKNKISVHDADYLGRTAYYFAVINQHKVVAYELQQRGAHKDFSSNELQDNFDAAFKQLFSQTLEK